MPPPCPPSVAGRTLTGTGVRICSLCHLSSSVFFSFPSSALCELFDKADVTKDGTISFAEYQAMCDEYGVKLQPEDRVAIKAIADEDGEVNTCETVCDIHLSCPQIHKNDFVMHLKQSSMLREFEVANEDSEIHWKKKADLAFR